MQWGSQGRLLNTEKTHSDFLITSLAYVTHHKHAYSLSTDRKIERMGEKEQRIFFFCGTKWCTKNKVCVSFRFKNKKKKTKNKTKNKTKSTTRGHKQDRLHTGKKRKNTAREQASSQRVQNRERERQTQRAENIRRLHSSHIKGAFFMEYFPGSFIHSNGS